ncbi:MAG: ferrochelatase, partial [Saezia sp.]
MMIRDKTGVLLLNLGTPDSPSASDVRKYLKEFLSDRRIVDLPSWQWKPILHGIILRTRPAKSAAKYASIWTPAGSPLLVHSRALCDALRNELDESMPDEFVVRFAMRYGHLSVAGILDEFVQIGIEKILVIPLYPQYSSTTTASALDAVYQWGMKQHYIPEFRFVNDYHDMLGYIDALCKQINKHWIAHGRSEKLLISFHSVPERLVDEGDPYQKQCLRTVELLVQALKLQEHEYGVTYQSRFGKEKWLEPATQATLEQLAK